tara:strand:- start:2575 stop:3684 length:1110 start_codon:yes stop_codon:yes gene_type:complete
MLDPQFLAQIRSYLNADGNRALNAGIGSITGSAPAAKPDALTSGIQSGISSVTGYADAKKASNQEFMPIPIQMNTPTSSYVPGRSGEFNYGIGNPQSATAIRAYNPDYSSGIAAVLPPASASASSQGRNRSDIMDRMPVPKAEPRGPSGRAMEDGMAPAKKGLGAGIQGLFRDAFDGGGFGAKGDTFKGGGIKSAIANAFGIKPIKRAEGGPIDEQMSDPMGGISNILPGANEKDLISQAISAIKGEVEDPRPVLAAFVSKYGEDALRNLVDKVEGGDVTATAEASQGQLRGPGDGMSDMIPASVDGQQDVLLSDGEYVVPADVVSGLGNGSSDAGAKHLDEMMARVRQQRTGSKEQAKQIEPKEAMPA